MLKINKQTITLTKGDDASLRLVPRYKDKTEYVLTEGDSAVFRIKFGHTLVELECTLNLETNKIVANITPNDTKDFNPGIYRYEAELITSFGFHYTFIADQTFILGQEYEQRITSTSNGNSSAVGGNLPEIDGIVDGEPVVYGDIQPTNPMMDYEELNHLPKLNNITIKGSHDNAYYGIPTKTSDLENDSDFVSDDDYVHTDNNYDDTAKNAVDALGTASTYDVPESGNASNSQVVKGDDSRLRDNRDPNPHTHSKADITDFPTNVSAFNNDSGFITNTVNNLANYYLKSETYTRAEVEQLIAAIKQGKFEIVAELPASGDANVIYLVPKSTAQTSNSYDEYAYINNAWEKIGDTDIDLSGYVTDDELTTALQSYLTTSAFNTAIASYYTKTETDNLLANKVDKVAGKVLSTNDYDNTAKGIVDGVTSALNDKVDKVQGKGLSTNDYDNTAKSIVDGVTSALADKVDKVNGKGLSTEDYTTAEKSKLGDISDNAKKVASSSANGHIEIDDVDTTVYDDTAVQNAIENIEDELSTDYATIEGNPINFTTKSAQNAKSTILSLEPIQDLHGYDKPWAGGAGKNLLKAKGYTTDDYTGTTFPQFGEGAYITEDVILPVGTYTVSIILISKPSTNRAIEIKPNLATFGHIDSYNLNQVYSYNFTLTEETTVNARLWGIEGGSFKIKMQIEKGSSATSWEPWENLCPISGRSEIGILGCGKNLFNNDNLVLKPWNGNTTNNARARLEHATKLPVGTTVTISVNNSFLSTYSYARYSLATDYPGTETTGDIGWISSASNTYTTEAPYFALVFKRNDGENITLSDLKAMQIQVEINLTPSAYEPYITTNDINISLGQAVYGGTLDVENGVLVVDKTNYVYDGTEDWLESSSWGKTNTAVYYCDNLPLAKITSQTEINTTFDLFGAKSRNYIYENDVTCAGFTGEKATTIRILRSIASDLSAFKSYLSSNNLTIIYPLATPITINLTPHTINLLKGVNNISTDGNKITLTYRDGSVATLGDLTSAVDSLDSKIDESKILTDTVTGDKYILVVTNGVLSVEQVSN